MLDLSEIVDVVSKVQGVVGIFLFGSLARGDFDEYSDYDLLVVFEDKVLMWRSWDELFRVVEFCCFSVVVCGVRALPYK